MEEMSMEKMPEFQEIKPGQIVRSKVIAVQTDKVIVDLGLKNDGVVQIAEFTALPEVGSEIDVFVVRMNSRDGSPVISYAKARDIVKWKNAEECFNTKKITNGTITKKIKGGYEVDLGVSAFMPSSHLDRRYSADPIGKTVEVKITEFDKKNRNVVVSNKMALKEIADNIKKITFASLKEGDVLKGRITTITDFGVFVDIGGIEGLIHINDVSYKRIEKLSDYFKTGDTIEVKVLKIDSKTEKIALGMKQLGKNPWDDVETKYRVGTRVKGKITTMTPFGIFVLLEDGIEGLVHVSDISWTERIAHPKDVFKEGQIIDAVVLSASGKDQKISLSHKHIYENPLEKYHVGDIVSGVVSKLMDFGCLVKLEDNMSGFVHVSEIARNRIDKPSDVLELGEEITAKIIKVDKEKKRIEMSIKKYDIESDRKDVKNYLASQNTRIKLGDLLDEE